MEMRTRTVTRKEQIWERHSWTVPNLPNKNHCDSQSAVIYPPDEVIDHMFTTRAPPQGWCFSSFLPARDSVQEFRHRFSRCDSSQPEMHLSRISNPGATANAQLCQAHSISVSGLCHPQGAASSVWTSVAPEQFHMAASGNGQERERKAHPLLLRSRPGSWMHYFCLGWEGPQLAHVSPLIFKEGWECLLGGRMPN